MNKKYIDKKSSGKLRKLRGRTLRGRTLRGWTLRGWTLSETLVGMIVSGVVFIAIMDGAALLGRWASSRAAQIAENMDLYDGYGLLAQLAASADSVSVAGGGAIGSVGTAWGVSGGSGREAGSGVEIVSVAGPIALFRDGALLATLDGTDGLLVCRRAGRTDTLIRGVVRSELVRSAELTGADTIKIAIRDGTISLAVRSAVERVAISKLEDYEKQYAYE